MASLPAIFVSSFILAFSGALMPGPLLTTTISESTRRGPTAGPILILGHGILEIVLLVLLFVGLSPFFQNRWVFIVIALAGSMILFCMAVGMFRSLPSLSLAASATAPPRGNLVVSGILMSLANPYWIIWWATVGFGLILRSQQSGFTGMLAFFTGHILADLAWYSVVSVAVGKGRHFLSDRFYRGVIGTCGIFLVGFACYFLCAGVGRLIT